MQHVGHIKAPAFTILPCWLLGLFVTFSSRQPIENCQLIKTFSEFALSVYNLALLMRNCENRDFTSRIVSV
jgi:hypothetical protein